MSECLDVLKDTLARVVRVREAFSDGDPLFAEQVLDDLAHDLWKVIEAIERDERSR